ncbi:MAG: DNA polymerase I, partial [Candidatus Hydrogenedentes bacterium]|nr:DNA polymerase I [Candidatus Hydrogenedentota bacterium]
MAEQLFLIDGTAFAYRSFYAIRGLSNSKGMATNAVFGFARVMLKMLREQDPSHVAVVFDAPGKTFRSDMFPEYKATRKETPEDLIAQLPLLDRLIEAFNIPVMRIARVEADDVIGTLARKAEALNMATVLVTGDKDALQLVTDKVKVYDPYKDGTGKWYGPEDVKERYGVLPEDVVNVMALMGDASDNVPGIQGIGEKTARTLMEKYGTLEELYKHTDELKGKQKERIEAGRDMAFLSRDLVTIKTDVDLEFDLDACCRRDFDKAALVNLFTELEFQSLAEEFLPDAVAEDAPEYELIITEESLTRVIDEMRAAGAFAVDTETTSTEPMRAGLVGVSLSCAANTGCYIPVGHTPELMAQCYEDVPAGETRLTRDKALEMLGPLLEDPAVGKAGHNIKYDLIIFAQAGVKLAGIIFDSMIASYLTDPSRIRHNLAEVSLHYLKRRVIPIAELIGTGAKQITFDAVPVKLACTYAAEDADISWRLREQIEPALEERGLVKLFKDVELPLLAVLASMEQAGIAIDTQLFEQLQREVAQQLHSLEREIIELAGEDFQINSPKQLQGILFGKLGLKPQRRTKTGFSTDMEVLEALAGEHPLPAKVLEYRTLEKLRGTYIEALPKLVNPGTGRIHTSFNQAVAATGRLSSSDPNLQNIPVRTALGRRIREGFIACDEGHRLISADYSQIELRILAHLSGDQALREAFEQDLDIHRDTAARIFDVMPETVTPEMRRQAKAVNFGVVYGISAFGLAKGLGISNKAAGRFIDQY